jgi:hypothetical protein
VETLRKKRISLDRRKRNWKGKRDKQFEKREIDTRDRDRERDRERQRETEREREREMRKK